MLARMTTLGRALNTSARIAALFALATSARGEADSQVATDAASIAQTVRAALDDSALSKVMGAIDLNLFSDGMPGLRGSLGFGFGPFFFVHIFADGGDGLGAVSGVGAGSVDLILTTGGTGVGPRDVTPEATSAAAEKLLPGLGERIRAVTGQNFPRAYLSRATAAVRRQTLIVNLPGSPKGAQECLDAVADLLPHAAEVLRGARHD